MKVLAALLASALVALVVPVAASAEVITVNSTADEPDKTAGAPCETAVVGKCTLRAAIEVSNSTTTVRDTIKFTAAFNGQLADTIALSSPLSITDEVTIDGDAEGSAGGRCSTEAAVVGPCVGVSGPTGNFGLTVEEEAVVIEGLAVTGALTGINVINASSDFEAHDDWIGVNLKGEAKPNNTGIFLDPDSNFAGIGGTTPAARNVIAGNANEGLDIQGADAAVIQGNYFGVGPNGSTQMANGKNIEITDSTAGGGFQASGNEVGATISAPGVESTECDAGCNVISGSSTGIDLNGNGSGQGEAAASGPTTVRGNFIGLNAAGEAVVATPIFGVMAGAADDVQVGGLASGDRNLIAGGTYGVYGENGDDLVVDGNTIGIGSTGIPVTPPTAAGVFAFAVSVTSNEAGATIEGNTIRMSGGSGIEHRFVGARIAGNTLEGGVNGILTLGNGNGSVIEANRLLEPAEAGIQLQNDNNVVVGNEVVGGLGPGIEVLSFDNGFGFPIVTANRIGGDTAGEENVLLENAGAAIRVSDVKEGQNEIARNRGSGNGGDFIFLISSVGGEESPGEGIQPPAFSTALQSTATGTSLPGARVRVFRKASAEPGELESFLGEATADGAGNWKVAYAAKVPVGTIVAATQTNTLGGTSELGTATSAADPPPPPAPPSPPKGDVTPPKAKITKAPKAKSTSTTAKFKFSSNEPGSSFQCKLDKGKFKKCRSPKTYKKLKPGKHVFKVKAIDAAGNVGKPATRAFTVLG